MTDNPYVFECAWEVANKVGGIYTVLRTKAPNSVQTIGDQNYFCVGIYNGAQAHTEFEPSTPRDPAIVETLASMREKGVTVHYGRWLIDGYPLCILFDIGSVWHNLNAWKADFFTSTHIGTPSDDVETNNAIVLGYLVCWFLGELLQREPEKRMVAHFHEWQAGVGLVLLRTRQLRIGTVFTTHATLLGRYLCAGAEDFYNKLEHFDCEYEAGERQIYHRYCLERSAAHSAHVFTTVSHVTALEAEHLLKRKPDVILPNGLNVVKFAALHEFQNLHQKAKEKIHKFIRGHFYGQLDFDLNKTLYFFLAGRYEFTNKGCDLYIEGLARLNHRLKASGSDKTVVAFIVMPAPTNNYGVEALKGQAVLKSLEDTIDVVEKDIRGRLFESAVRGEITPKDQIMTRQDELRMKKCLYAMQRSSDPPVVTHNLINDAKDDVMNALRKCQLLNRKDDRVKVIFHPEFVKSTSPLLPLDYDDFVRGCHMGVFPSYYEPWGYTPAECTVMGVPSITSNLSGFGLFMEEHVHEPESYGIYVVDRRFKSPDESANQLVDFMYDFTVMEQRQRIQLRNRNERLSDILDWGKLGLYYKKARDLAIRRSFGDDSAPAPVKVDKVQPPKSPKLSMAQLNLIDDDDSDEDESAAAAREFNSNALNQTTEQKEFNASQH